MSTYPWHSATSSPFYHTLRYLEPAACVLCMAAGSISTAELS